MGCSALVVAREDQVLCLVVWAETMMEAWKLPIFFMISSRFDHRNLESARWQKWDIVT